jgi:DUF4097 and DUF4098 domain-containing protein YvlB
MVMSETEAVVEEQFSVGDSPELSLGTVSGRVSIEPSSEPVIRVRALKHGRASAVENTAVEFSRDGDAVSVRTKSVSRKILGGDTVCSIDFDVQVPRGCVLRIDAVSADVDVRGIGGAVDAHTVSGRVDLDNASESISVRTVSGRLTAHGLNGVLRLNTVSGDALITDSSLSEFEVESVSGALQLETSLSATGRYRARTVSGGIEVRIPHDIGVTVHLTSVSGRIRSELPSSIEKVGFGNWHATISGGGSELRLNSVSGNVTIAQIGAPVPA